MWNLKHDTNEPIYETERFVDMEKRLVAVKGGEGGMECEVGLAEKVQTHEPRCYPRGKAPT